MPDLQQLIDKPLDYLQQVGDAAALVYKTGMVRSLKVSPGLSLADREPLVKWVTFNAVRVRPRSNFPGRANGTLVQGSSDGGTTWTTLTTVTGITDGNQSSVFPLAAPTTQSMLRISDNHGGFTNLAEVQLLTTS